MAETCIAMSRASATNSSFFEQSRSRMKAPPWRPPGRPRAHRPRRCRRRARGRLFLPPRRASALLKSQVRLSMSPSASVSAFLHSMTETPVLSRSSLTASAEISAIYFVLSIIELALLRSVGESCGHGAEIVGISSRRFVEHIGDDLHRRIVGRYGVGNRVSGRSRSS